jgi:spermidine/putrescine transport system ATP-binding protein
VASIAPRQNRIEETSAHPEVGNGRPSVELQSVTKRFGDVVAVAELSLALEPGEFFTLLGPSGCGKTTTLRMVAGFEEPTAGAVLIDGEDVVALPAHRRPTNTVFQSYALFPHLSVGDNVAFGLRRKKAPRDEIDRRVREELERVGLAAQANRKPNQLSGGQQQRVALARALVNYPKVLLLDEPLGALDLKLRKGLQVELKRIQREVGITFLYVTHDQEEALTMSDRVAVMNEGHVEQVGSAEDVYERPATAFVAGFIGVSNLMPGLVSSAGGGRGKLRLDSGAEVEVATDGLREGERCHAVVRPEKLRIALANEAAPAGPNGPAVEGVVESSVFLGTSTQIVVRLAGDVPITVLVPNADEAERQRLPGGGARVAVSWSPEHTHVVRDGDAKTSTDNETNGGDES